MKSFHLRGDKYGAPVKLDNPEYRLRTKAQRVFFWGIFLTDGNVYFAA